MDPASLFRRALARGPAVRPLLLACRADLLRGDPRRAVGNRERERGRTVCRAHRARLIHAPRQHRAADRRQRGEDQFASGRVAAQPFVCWARSLGSPPPTRSVAGRGQGWGALVLKDAVLANKEGPPPGRALRARPPSPRSLRIADASRRRSFTQRRRPKAAFWGEG